MTKTSLPNFQTRFIIDIQRYIESNYYYFETGNKETTALNEQEVRIKLTE